MVRWWVFLLIVLAYSLYVTMGGLVFMLLERENELTVLKSAAMYRIEWLEDELDILITKLTDAYTSYGMLNNESSDIALWNVYTSIYFAVTVVTTIGYGNLTPVTVPGQWFCIFFALCGIPLALVTFTALGLRIAYVVESMYKICSKWNICRRHRKIMKIVRFVIVQGCFLGIIVLIPSTVFDQLENWTYTDSVYYAVVTLTTIGFGDCVAGFDESSLSYPAYRLMVAAWIFVGLSWMSSTIALAQKQLGNLFKKLHQVVEDYDEDETKLKEDWNNTFKELKE